MKYIYILLIGLLFAGCDNTPDKLQSSEINLETYQKAIEGVDSSLSVSIVDETVYLIEGETIVYAAAIYSGTDRLREFLVGDVFLVLAIGMFGGAFLFIIIRLN